VTPADDTDATEEDTVTSTDQNDPLAVYYAEVQAATTKFYAAMDRQATEKQRQAEQAQARADEHTATMVRVFEQFEERTRKRRAAAAARDRAERAKAKAQAADQTPGPEHDG
jgi:hypothetical protein